MEKLKVGKALVDNITFEESVEKIIGLAKAHKAEFVVTPNVDHLLRLEKNKDFQEIYRNAALVVADGMPIIWASRFLNVRLPHRIAGSDLMPRLCEEAEKHSLKVFILGGPPGVGEIAAEKLLKKHPKLDICGVYSPPFGFEKDEEENAKIIDMLNEAKPDFVFVGVGSPKQENWIAKYRSQLDVGVLLGIGATVEFIAGSVKRAPVIMQKTGTEWFYRITQDPKRLAIRYAKNFAVFALFFRDILKWRKERQKILNEVASDKLKIKPASILDLFSVLRLQRKGFDPGHFSAFRTVRNLLVADIKLKAVIKGRTAGYIFYNINSAEKTCWLSPMAVDPVRRGLGIGRRLNEAGEKLVYVNRIVLILAVTNEIAIGLYKKLGFEIKRSIPNYYATGEDAYEIEKLV